VYRCSAKCRRTDWDRYWFTEFCTRAKQTTTWDVFLQCSNGSKQAIILTIGLVIGEATAISFSSVNQIKCTNVPSSQDSVWASRFDRPSSSRLLDSVSSVARRFLKHFERRLILTISFKKVLETPIFRDISLCVRGVCGPYSWLITRACTYSMFSLVLSTSWKPRYLYHMSSHSIDQITNCCWG